ncbi:MAG: hypothetical protein F4Y80_08140 [Caldilineaceae bacterium SB0665_bin_21]|nr:hypothetical protein [Caldilineaceae bacterium SB0665_bin_21]MYA04473.1 hypothetical protein [Caldilineaceae bacterium SB0664_bin_22]MYC64669.1 hypothetical protein [Caldilineaceae bacterium SB0661_bin_34]
MSLTSRLHRPTVPPVRWRSTIVWAAGLGALLAFVSVRTASAGSAAQTFPGSNAVEAWPVLVPMLAASASLERAIEVFWNLVEWFLLRVGGWQAADLKRPDYTQLKSGLSLIIAGVLGVAITGYTDIRLLSYLQPQANGILDQVPVAWDVLLSGILLGTGTKPVHDLVGTLTRVKMLVGNLGLKQRERAGLFAADANYRIREAELHGTRSMAAHQPTRRTTQQDVAATSAPDRPARRLIDDLDARYNG